MSGFVWLLFGLVAVTQGLSVKQAKLETKPLIWPNQFSLKAKRMSLTSNIIENYNVWKTSKQSRVDFNDGYVKYFLTARNKQHRYGVVYEIHPEADEDQEVEFVCSGFEGNKWHQVEPQTILPDVDGFEADGEEIMYDKECTKFIYDVKDESTNTESTIWATYDKKAKSWIPVRYEVLEFNSWLGSKDKHDIWDFYDYDPNFSVRKVFSVDDYDCETLTTLTFDSEAVTKHLRFVNPENNAHVDHVFNSFKTNFNKTYGDDREHAMRRSIFRENMRHIIQHNRLNKGYKLAINQFADKTPEEMQKHMGLLRRPEGKVGTVAFPYDDEKVDDLANNLPKEYDARLLGLVSNIKNQEDCGSCWTFGTTAAVEGALARINGGTLMALSNQALVDCAWPYGAYGCDGGTDNAAYEWMMEYGLPTEAEYGSYANKDGPCQIKNMTTTYPIRGFTDVTPLSVGALKVALVNHGPLSVSVQYTSRNHSPCIHPASSMILNGNNELHLNHEVSLVGYGERDGDTFWILKNSWGPQWGIGGYMYISARDNICGVATEPTYVVF